MDAINLLKNNFDWLQKSHDFRDHLINPDHLLELKKGTVILETNNYIRHIPFILSGLAKVYREDNDGNEVLLYYIKPGESCIMSITTYLRDDKSSIKAIIEEDATLIALPSEEFNKHLKKYPPLNEFVYSLFQEKYLELIDFIQLVTFSRQEDRLIKYLRKEAELKGSNELKITHKKIAEDLATSREVVSRLLKKLQDRNILKQKHLIIELL